MANIPDFKYAPMFQLGEDKTEYRLLSKEGVSTGEFEGKTILKVSKSVHTRCPFSPCIIAVPVS